VIDVVGWCIVQLVRPCRYLTLSYVWGIGVKFQAMRNNIAELSSPGALREDKIWDQLSSTIMDSMLLTELLGERYLWVDSLCIVKIAAMKQWKP
jgi:hypothetical protein